MNGRMERDLENDGLFFKKSIDTSASVTDFSKSKRRGLRDSKPHKIEIHIRWVRHAFIFYLCINAAT